MINEPFKEPVCQTVQGMVACFTFKWFSLSIFYLTMCPGSIKADNVNSMQAYCHAAASAKEGKRKRGRGKGEQGEGKGTVKLGKEGGKEGLRG